HLLGAVEGETYAVAVAFLGAADGFAFGPHLAGAVEDGDEHAGLDAAAGAEADACGAGVDHFDGGESCAAAAVGVDGACGAAGCLAAVAAALEGVGLGLDLVLRHGVAPRRSPSERRRCDGAEI